jgi:hypothetical protein
MTTEITESTSQVDTTGAYPPGMNHESYMASLNGGTTEATTQTEATETTEAKARPDNIPAKFWDSEKGEVRLDVLLKSQADFEKMARSKQGLTIQNDAAEAASGETGDATATATTDDLASAYTAFQETLTAKNGELEDTDFAALEKHVPREIIDAQMQMMKEHAALTAELEGLKREKFEAGIFASAGGQDKYQEITAWAATNLSAQEQAQFDALIINSDTAQMAFEGLKARFLLANPSEGQRLSAPTSTSVGETFGDWSEVTKVMNSKEYKTNAAYRQTVQERLTRSHDTGVLPRR